MEAIRAGETLHLECNYDLEEALLYSIKWYFGDNEFYRYVPKESPPTRVFPLAGIIVDVSLWFLCILHVCMRARSARRAQLAGRSFLRVRDEIRLKC